MRFNKRGEVDWASPTTLVVIILAILLGIAFIWYITTVSGRIAP